MGCFGQICFMNKADKVVKWIARGGTVMEKEPMDCWRSRMDFDISENCA
jgi:hypothetical protein